MIINCINVEEILKKFLNKKNIMNNFIAKMNMFYIS